MIVEFFPFLQIFLEKFKKSTPSKNFTRVIIRNFFFKILSKLICLKIIKTVTVIE
jgi:hypothetical protein